MLTWNKIVFFLAITIYFFTYPVYSARAENFTDANNPAEEDITLTGESLQGIEPKNISNDSNDGQNPLTEVTIERDKTQNNNGLKTGNEFIDSLIEQPQTPKNPLDEGFDKNQGDRSTMPGGTIPLVNF